MKTEELSYNADGTNFTGFVAAPDNVSKAPLVLICHDWSGRNDFAIEKAKAMAAFGYIGFALDMYGDAKIGADNDEKTALMMPMVEDRAMLRTRVLAALAAASALPGVDQQRIAVMGFCFGGLCALDLARASSDIKAALSFHGFLNAPDLDNSALKAKVMVLHGYQDPMVAPDALPPFYDEMTAAGIDWQVHIYGQAKHAFTNPVAHDQQLGTVYDEASNHRAMQTMAEFLKEAFS